jgi:hypothetical protein
MEHGCWRQRAKNRRHRAIVGRFALPYAHAPHLLLRTRSGAARMRLALFSAFGMRTIAPLRRAASCFFYLFAARAPLARRRGDSVNGINERNIRQHGHQAWAKSRQQNEMA